MDLSDIDPDLFFEPVILTLYILYGLLGMDSLGSLILVLGSEIPLLIAVISALPVSGTVILLVLGLALVSALSLVLALAVLTGVLTVIVVIIVILLAVIVVIAALSAVITAVPVIILSASG